MQGDSGKGNNFESTKRPHDLREYLSLHCKNKIRKGTG